jgi:uncharacterized membrane protein (UPF0182 family)
MFVLITLLVLLLSFALLAAGLTLRRGGPARSARSTLLLTAGALVLVLLIAGGWALDLWADYLWFQSEGFAERYRTELFTGWNMIGVAAVVALVPVLIVGYVGRAPAILTGLAALLAAWIGGVTASGNWGTWLVYRHAEPTGMVDPVLGRDVSFYLLQLPFLELGFAVGAVGVIVAAILGAVTVLMRFGKLGLEETLQRVAPGGETDRFLAAFRRRNGEGAIWVCSSVRLVARSRAFRLDGTRRRVRVTP